MIRIRNLYAFLLFCIKHKKIRAFSLIINIMVLILSISDIKRILLYPIVMAVFLLLLNIIWQIISTFIDFRYCIRFERLDESTCNIEKKAIIISEKERQGGFDCLQTAYGFAILSDKLNKHLQDEIEPGCKIEKSKSERVKQYIDMHFELLFLFLKCHFQDANSKRFHFYNEKKLCLADDIESETVSPVGFCKGNYYDNHITNRIHFLSIKDKNGQTFRSPLFAEYKFSLPDISSSEYCNQIGVSTIGFTSDGYIVLLEQSSKANASSGLIVPTCSGSVNWTDYRDNQFFDTIKYATKRELYEECGKISSKSPDTIARTKIVGYFRWINYGGQPQFVSISAMNVKYAEIDPLISEQTKRKLCSERFHSENKEYIIIDVINKYLNKIIAEEQCSLPLHLSIHVLQKFIENSQAEFEQFLLVKNKSN